MLTPAKHLPYQHFDAKLQALHDRSLYRQLGFSESLLFFL